MGDHDEQVSWLAVLSSDLAFPDALIQWPL